MRGCKLLIVNVRLRMHRSVPTGAFCAERLTTGKNKLFANLPPVVLPANDAGAIPSVPFALAIVWRPSFPEQERFSAVDGLVGVLLNEGSIQKISGNFRI